MGNKNKSGREVRKPKASKKAKGVTPAPGSVQKAVHPTTAPPASEH